MHPSCSYLACSTLKHASFLLLPTFCALSALPSILPDCSLHGDCHLGAFVCEVKMQVETPPKSPRKNVQPLLPQQPSMSHAQNWRPVENIKDTAYKHLKSVSAAGCTAGRTMHAQRCNATAKWNKKKTRCHTNHIVVLSSGVETTHTQRHRAWAVASRPPEISLDNRTPDKCTPN